MSIESVTAEFGILRASVDARSANAHTWPPRRGARRRPGPPLGRRQLAHGFGQGAAAAGFMNGLPAPVAVEEMGFDRFDLSQFELGAEVGGQARILMDHGGGPSGRRERRAGAGPDGDGPGSSHGASLRSPPPPGR